MSETSECPTVLTEFLRLSDSEYTSLESFLTHINLKTTESDGVALLLKVHKF